MTATPSPKGPQDSGSDKSKRYDRQLRLWGENGQQALETSHVCLINATAVGTEILKSLVLPGIRAFTIIDDNKVSEDDYDSNFFLCAEGSLGQPRAKIAAEMLIEMNDDVKKGDYVEEHFETLLDNNSQFFTNFTLVIACGIENERSLNKLSQALWSLNVPLLLVKSIGFFGYIRLQIKEHTVIEPHPDNYLEDLRLDMMFPELKNYLDSYPDFESLSRKDLTHIPSLVIIYKNLQKWRKKFEKSDDEVPRNYKEKSQLSSQIKDEMESLKEMKAIKLEDIEHPENPEFHMKAAFELENFEEATKMINKVFVDSHKVPASLQLLLDEVKDEGRKFTSAFWVMMSALKQFIDKFNCLPLKGSIPDMNCGSEHYIKLQNVYKDKAKQDVDMMQKLIQNVPKSTTVIIPEAEVQLFCKNARYLSVLRSSPIYEELTGNALRKMAAQRLQNAADEEGCEIDELRFYLLMRLVDRFFSKQHRFPGQRIDEVESDISELKREFRDFCTDLGYNILIKDELIHEICRYGGCELHSISAFLGGCAAQEAIKLITGQYVPINNTFVYNGLNCTSVTYTL